MSEYVKKSEAKQSLCDYLYPNSPTVISLIDKAIDATPTADVQEVLYCKNCKNYCKYSFDTAICEEYGGYIKPNDFCSRGEKK